MIAARGVGKTFVVEVNAPMELKERVVAWARRERIVRREIRALIDVDLTVDSGEAVALIGNNGAGKSTLLRCLAGIVEPSAGEIELVGRTTALLELSAGFHPQLTGRENIFLHASLHGVGRAATERQIDAIVRFSQLQEFINVPLKAYSAGMILRLGFSISIHLDPDILLIDESLAVGDYDFQKQCLARMSELRDGGCCVVLATHDLETARNFCSRALLLHDGRCVAQGAPDEVCTAYERHYAGASTRLGAAPASPASTPAADDTLTPQGVRNP